jgi:hypothetical protein
MLRTEGLIHTLPCNHLSSARLASKAAIDMPERCYPHWDQCSRHMLDQADDMYLSGKARRFSRTSTCFHIIMGIEDIGF